MRLLTDEQHAQIVALLQEPTYNRCKEARATLTAAPRLEVVAKIDQPNNARMFTLTEGAGYDRFDNLYAIKKETP